jgi:hypothetical protein
MPKQLYYLLLVNRDSTTEVVKEERNVGEVTKVRSWNESTVSWNFTRHAQYSDNQSNSKLVFHLGEKYGISHNAYWEYAEMYKKICEDILS